MGVGMSVVGVTRQQLCMDKFMSPCTGAPQSLSATLVGDFSLIIRGRYENFFLIVPLVIIAIFM